MASRPRGEAPGSLLHPLYGFAAQDVRRAVGASHLARLAQTEALVERMRRHDALHRKGFRGFVAGADRVPITPDTNGHLRGRSLTPAFIFDRDPNDDPHTFIYDIDIDELRTLLDIQECECCPEDITWQVTIDPGEPLGVTFDPETCTWRLNFPCDPCNPAGPGGG